MGTWQFVRRIAGLGSVRLSGQAEGIKEVIFRWEIQKKEVAKDYEIIEKSNRAHCPLHNFERERTEKYDSQ